MPILMNNVELLFGDDDYSCHVSQVEFSPNTSTVSWQGMGGDAAFVDASAATWQVTLAFAQDWSPEGFATYLHAHEGETVTVSFRPAVGALAFTAKVVLAPGSIGGSIDTVATSTVTLTVLGKPKRLPPALPVGPLTPLTFSGQSWVPRMDQGAPTFNGAWASETGTWVDEDGYLHLKVQKIKGFPYAAEVVSERGGLNPQKFGYGKYRWVIEKDITSLYSNIILGLFTYDGTAGAPSHNNEIDFEAGGWSWGPPRWDHTYFRTGLGSEPSKVSIGMLQFDPTTAPVTTHEFEWLPDRIIWRSWHGTDTTGAPDEVSEAIDGVAYSWTHTNGTFSGVHVTPTPRNEKVIMNLWVSDGNPASPGNSTPETEVVIRSFTFTPSP